jgi:formylglycine-generating enzyme required for sulfatase activity
MLIVPDMPVCAVAPGRYPLGSDTGPQAARPAHTVELAAFAIGRTAVTNAQFAPFVANGGYNDARWWGETGWRWRDSRRADAPGFWDVAAFNAPAQPVVGVCWYEADAFARWLAQHSGQPWRLPTEAEWEAAARGIEPQPLPDAARVNSAEWGLGRAWPADQGAASWCGALNLLGNVWEWCSTRWGRNWQTLDYPYPYNPDDGREQSGGSHARVMRGGSWYDGAAEAHPSSRGRYLPGSRGSNIGFRLARSL